MSRSLRSSKSLQTKKEQSEPGFSGEHICSSSCEYYKHAPAHLSTEKCRKCAVLLQLPNPLSRPAGVLCRFLKAARPVFLPARIFLFFPVFLSGLQESCPPTSPFFCGFLLFETAAAQETKGRVSFRRQSFSFFRFLSENGFTFRFLWCIVVKRHFCSVCRRTVKFRPETPGNPFRAVCRHPARLFACFVTKRTGNTA